MKTKTKQPSYIKALKIGGVALVSAGLVAGTVIMSMMYNTATDNNDKLAQNLANVNAALDVSLINSNSQANLINEMNESLSNYGIQVENFTQDMLNQSEVIADYAAIIAEMEAEDEATASAEVVLAQGYDEDFTISTFDFGTLNDNQLEILGDYNVDFDGDDVSVNEYLDIQGAFETEDEVSMNFEDGDIVYTVEFDTGLDFNEDSLEVKFLGDNIEITEIEADKMTIKKADKVYAVTGDIVSEVEIVRISEESIMVKNGNDLEVIALGATDEINDIKVSVESIFYIEGADDNMAVIRVGEDLDKTIEVGDYYDEDVEEWKYTTIEDGKIELTLDEDFDEVETLVMPNDFVTVSFELSDEDYNEVELVKNNDLFEEVNADFENYDATTVEYNGTNWIIEDDNGDDLIVTELELKDSDYTIEFVNETFVTVAGIDVTPTTVDVSGDDDELFFTEEGIIVEPHDDWNEEDDEELVIRVPEEAVEIKVSIN